MLFYQVNSKGADKDRYTRNRHGKLKVDGSFAPNELYTERELNRFARVNMNWFTPVQISKRNTFWMFGCRFVCEDVT